MPKTGQCTPQLLMVLFDTLGDRRPSPLHFTVKDIAEHSTIRQVTCVTPLDKTHHSLITSDIFRDERLPAGFESHMKAFGLNHKIWPGLPRTSRVEEHQVSSAQLFLTRSLSIIKWDFPEQLDGTRPKHRIAIKFVSESIRDVI